MTENQPSEESALLQWVAAQLGEDDAEEVERTRCFRDQMEELGLQWDDVLHALRNATAVRRDYGSGCYTLTGPTIDGEPMEIVMAPPSEKNRVRLIKMWRAL